MLNRLWAGWHVWWHNHHLNTADSCEADAFTFLELENYTEAARLSRRAQEEKDRALAHFVKGQRHLTKLVE